MLPGKVCAFLLLLPLFSKAEVVTDTQILYVATDLGTLPGDASSGGIGINALGQVTGVSGILSTTPHAFIYSDGVMTAVPTLAGLPYSEGWSINDAGQAVGVAYDSYLPPTTISRGYIYSHGTLTDIGSLTGAGGTSSAVSINDSGQVVGTSSSPTGVAQAFIYSHGVMTDLGTLPGQTGSLGTAINASGQATGTSGNHAFIYSNGAMTDIGQLGHRQHRHSD
jgi:probable HAF family extracellular repeat protein